MKNYIFKILLIGNGGVGKTSLLRRYVEGFFDKSTIMTVGVDFFTKELIFDNVRCFIQLWDLGGQERFRFMWRDFLKGAGLAILVCDSTEDNIEKTKEIYKKFSRYIGSKIIAIANKQDLPNALSAEQVEKKLGIPTYGMSAIRVDLRGRIKRILEYEMESKK